MRTVFLIDMNAYFASVEQVSNPALRGKPIAVCGKGRTVVTTASYEARAFGVKTGMSLFEAKRTCPQLIPVYGDMHKYIDTTHRIHKIALQYTDLLEAFSIDECFLDLSHVCKREDDAKNIALKIKSEIKEQLGLLCSIGIGSNKVTAKIGSKLQKPDGLVEIREKDIPLLFKKLSVDQLQGVGVGRKTAAKLKTLGILTAYDLGIASEDLLMHHFGIIGHYLKNIGQGKDSSPINKYFEHEQVKSIGHSRTLPKNTWDLNIIRSYLLMLCEKTGRRLRAASLEGNTVNFFLRYGDFTHFGVQKNLKTGIWDSSDIYRHACELLKKCIPLKKPARLVGVSISTLSKHIKQRYLFEDYHKKQLLTETIDSINNRYGSFTIKPSSVLIAEKFGIDEGCGMVAKERIKMK